LSSKASFQLQAKYLASCEVDKLITLLPKSWQLRFQDDFSKLQNILTKERRQKLIKACVIISDKLLSNESGLSIFLSQFPTFRELNHYDHEKSYDKISEIHNTIKQSELLLKTKGSKLSLDDFASKTLNPILLAMKETPSINYLFQEATTYTLKEVIDEMPYVKVSNRDINTLSVLFHGKNRILRVVLIEDVWLPEEAVSLYSDYKLNMDIVWKTIELNESVVDNVIDNIMTSLKSFNEAEKKFKR